MVPVVANVTASPVSDADTIRDLLIQQVTGRYGIAVEQLRTVRNRAARFGGSHAQRDIIDLTLIAAAGLAGEDGLERALLAERAAALPLI